MGTWVGTKALLFPSKDRAQKATALVVVATKLSKWSRMWGNKDIIRPLRRRQALTENS